MITESSVYWILKLSDIRTMLFVFVVFTGAFAVGSGVGWSVNAGIYEETADACKKAFYRSVALAFLLAIPATLLPTTKQMAMIKVIPAIANSEIVGEMSADAKELYRMGINAIKEQLSDKKGARK